MSGLMCDCGAPYGAEDKSMGAFSFFTCDNCGEQSVVMYEYKSPGQTPEQKTFWDNWNESLSIYRDEFDGKSIKPDFKTWHNERIKRQKTAS